MSENTPDRAVKKAVLVVSFGTTYEENRELTIGAIERAISRNYEGYDVARAFTSKIIRRVLTERDGLTVYSVEEAMKRLSADGYEELVIQPTYMIKGIEYDETVQTVEANKALFSRCIMGRPALDSEEDFCEIVKITAKELQNCYNDKTAVVLMGHGSDHEANSAYEKLDRCFKHAGYPNFAVGTVEANPSLSDILMRVKAMNVEKVLLSPLMVVAGEHVNHDMAGEDEDSWKSVFEAAGYQVSCILRGLGEYEGIQQLFIKHAKNAQ